MPASTADLTCLQCGAVARVAGAKLCRRCGLPYGEAPPAIRKARGVPGLLRNERRRRPIPVQRPAGDPRSTSTAHVDEHEQLPVGDDEWLESLREHDRLRIGRWSAPFDLVRRYLVTGIVDAGRNRLGAAQLDRHRDDPDPALGPGSRRVRRPGGMEGRARRRRGADGPLPRATRAGLPPPSLLVGPQPVRSWERRSPGAVPGSQNRSNAR